MQKRNKVLIGGIAAGTVLAGASAAAAAYLAGRRIYQALDLGGRKSLRGQTVAITGGSRGLGLAMALEFAAEGCNLVICARDRQELDRARTQLEEQGAIVHTVVCDISKEQDAQRLIAEATDTFGNIDILVNNAGVISVGPLLSQTVDDFREAMDVMFWGMVHPTLAILPEMVRRGRGKIVNITSIGGKVSVPHLVPYCCAKFAAVAFSEGLHAELKRFGINVLTVAPGLMRTGSHLNAQFKGKHRQEYGWFSLSGTNPLFSISAERAAKQIVRATKKDQAELIISWQAELLARAHGIAPGLVNEAMALVARFLPTEQGGTLEKKKGHESQSLVTKSPLTALGKRAARKFNQLGETA